MGKKCIPGLFCIGNMTLFLVFLLFLFVFYIFLRITDLGKKNSSPIIVMNPYTFPRENPLTNLYAPPLQNDMVVLPPVATQSTDVNYRQIGILTRKHDSSEILPLMGRRQIRSRNKWQYYTMTGNNIQMKLPVSVNGKSCTGEYGCDEIYNNDTVYVEGFKDIFIATIYENNSFIYNP